MALFYLEDSPCMDVAEWVALKRHYEKRREETKHPHQKTGDIRNNNNKLALTMF